MNHFCHDHMTDCVFWPVFAAVNTFLLSCSSVCGRCSCPAQNHPWLSWPRPDLTSTSLQPQHIGLSSFCSFSWTFLLLSWHCFSFDFCVWLLFHVVCSTSLFFVCLFVNVSLWIVTCCAALRNWKSYEVVWSLTSFHDGGFWRKERNDTVFSTLNALREPFWVYESFFKCV